MLGLHTPILFTLSLPLHFFHVEEPTGTILCDTKIAMSPHLSLPGTHPSLQYSETTPARNSLQSSQTPPRTVEHSFSLQISVGPFWLMPA